MSGSYYVPAESKWPLVASIGLFFCALGGGLFILQGVPWLFLLGLLIIFYMFYGWFSNVVSESRAGLYDAQMDRSFRWGMSWFIFSEVMFFAAFFGALFYVRQFAVPWLAGEGDKGLAHMLWPEFTAKWPVMTPPDAEQFQGPNRLVDPWHLPLLNTILLVSSSFTLTWAHHALKKAQRGGVLLWMLVTIALGLAFLYVQAYEYYEAYTELGLTLHAGIYGATFFILTGFHGLHVTLGTLILIVIFVRVLKGHFSEDKHFGFEASAWYWHFVDVVWLGLFIFVYVV
ncbi:cytochrome c oxidase subunit 3 [Balneatrix alpica]|uniref:cytochrome-c oxidase n=1 Tax=Balneatrix alpica TaxID=75684 RepID=A0ABV5Z9L6_9GAMM|nr:cytochrome c oxidase subunit 3 [Balneatrix alpica]